MKQLSITMNVKVCSLQELSVDEQRLVAHAKEASQRSYSPYSHFQVGTSLLLADGTVLTGSNQENAAYPSGMCAERIVLYYAGSQYPNIPIKTMAIASFIDGRFTRRPCPPCGACRQVMLETESRQNGTPIRVVLYGEDECYIIEGGTKELLPLQFDKGQIIE